ncbi:MAG TPA: hypothetical protein VH092_25480 [Urbifossiella sp.]|jgi:hypothetical protein|nr:hypothetical protein [Urbifossiella sp.]
MTTAKYRYRFTETSPAEEVEATLILALFAVEALHGEAQTRLDAGHAFDRKVRTVVIDAATPVGRDFNRLFLGFLTREFGPGSFRVERVPQPQPPEPAAA